MLSVQLYMLIYWSPQIVLVSSDWQKPQSGKFCCLKPFMCHFNLQRGWNGQSGSNREKKDKKCEQGEVKARSGVEGRDLRLTPLRWELVAASLRLTRKASLELIWAWTLCEPRPRIAGLAGRSCLRPGPGAKPSACANIEAVRQNVGDEMDLSSPRKLWKGVRPREREEKEKNGKVVSSNVAKKDGPGLFTLPFLPRTLLSASSEVFPRAFYQESCPPGLRDDLETHTAFMSCVI